MPCERGEGYEAGLGEVFHKVDQPQHTLNEFGTELRRVKDFMAQPVRQPECVVAKD